MDELQRLIEHLRQQRNLELLRRITDLVTNKKNITLAKKLLKRLHQDTDAKAIQDILDIIEEDHGKKNT